MSEPSVSNAPTQEIMLLDLIERLDRLRADRVALHIHLSNLTPVYKRNNYIRIAISTFMSNVANFEGQVFVLANDDIVFVAKGVTENILRGPVDRLRFLFNEDPLVQAQNENDGMTFCTWYNLETDYRELLSTARNLLQQADKVRAEQEFFPGADAGKLRGPIRPELLAKLEQLLSKADLSNVVRRQTVCTLLPNQAPQPLFEEIFVSIEDLQSLTTPGIDLLANRWLFQYLTQTLDQRVMTMLMRDGINSNRPFSLNLNVATVLSPEFAKFETTITPQLRGRLVIEMNKLDVFSDMGAFIFARDYLRDRGFRVCLDGLTHQTLPYYDRAKLGFDLIKIYWTPEGINHMPSAAIPVLREMIMQAGQARAILCRCDSQQAIEFGQGLGIVMFQGRHVEHIMNATRTPRF